MSELTYTPMTAHPTQGRAPMLIDTGASFADLFQSATLRHSSVRDMLFTVNSLASEGGQGGVDARDVSNIAFAAYLLLNDADDLMLAMQHAHTRELARAGGRLS